MNLLWIIALGIPYVTNKFKKPKFSPLFVFSLPSASSEAKAHSSSVCQLLWGFELAIFSNIYLSVDEYYREKI